MLLNLYFMMSMYDLLSVACIVKVLRTLRQRDFKLSNSIQYKYEHEVSLRYCIPTWLRRLRDVNTPLPSSTCEMSTFNLTPVISKHLVNDE